MGTDRHNHDLDRWVSRLASKTHQALLLLIEGGHTGREIEQATGVAEPNVYRLRTKYEKLSGQTLPRVRLPRCLAA